VIETLSLAIKSDARIKGFNFFSKFERFVLSMYADDTAVVFRSPEELLLIKEKMDLYCLASEARFNITKCQGFFNGPIPPTLQNMDFEWLPKKHEVRYLGVQVGTAVKIDDYWDKQIDKIQKIFRLWSSKNLTLKGRIVICKTLGLPQLIYGASSLDISEDKIKKVGLHVL